MAMSASSLYPFPPSSIAHNTQAIIDECELAEMSHTNADSVPIVEMAALLYLGEYIHARHLWRRHRDMSTLPSATRAALEEWWHLGRAMMTFDFHQVWSRLHHLKQPQNQPQPFCDYAQQVGDGFIRRIVPRLIQQQHNATSDMVLGLPRQEWGHYVEQYRKEIAEAKNSAQEKDITQIISFLESPAVSL